MTPSEIREWILKDHRMLRGLLDDLDALAQQVRDGDRRLIGPLRLEAERFLHRFDEHTRWEDAYLRPALLEADAWGSERAERLDHDHREQRALLADSLARLRYAERPPVLVARGVLDLIALIRTDMEEEERDLLDPRILRDDVISIDTEAG
ncbi:MAG: hemerythrin domain-containing protein [Myxococcota bacterium]